MPRFLKEDIKIKSAVMQPYNKNLKIALRDLLNNITQLEKCLWSKLRSKWVLGIQNSDNLCFIITQMLKCLKYINFNELFWAKMVKKFKGFEDLEITDLLIAYIKAKADIFWEKTGH